MKIAKIVILVCLILLLLNHLGVVRESTLDTATGKSITGVKSKKMIYIVLGIAVVYLVVMTYKYTWTSDQRAQIRASLTANPLFDCPNSYSKEVVDCIAMKMEEYYTYPTALAMVNGVMKMTPDEKSNFVMRFVQCLDQSCLSEKLMQQNPKMNLQCADCVVKRTLALTGGDKAKAGVLLMNPDHVAKTLADCISSGECPAPVEPAGPVPIIQPPVPQVPTPPAGTLLDNSIPLMPTQFVGTVPAAAAPMSINQLRAVLPGM